MASSHVVTANATLDGAVVYLAPDRRWTRRFEESLVIEDATARDALLAWALGQEAHVCDPYVIEVAVGPEGLSSKSTRERLRAAGRAAVLERLGLARRGRASVSRVQRPRNQAVG